MVETRTVADVVLERREVPICPNCKLAHENVFRVRIGKDDPLETILCGNCINAVFGFDPDAIDGEIESIEDLEVQTVESPTDTIYLGFIAVALGGLVAGLVLLVLGPVFGTTAYPTRVLALCAWILTLGWIYVREYFH